MAQGKEPFSKAQQKLVDCFKKINYSFRHCGCDMYSVVNDLGRETDFIFDTEKIELKADKIFGEHKGINKYGSSGCVIFYFKNAIIEYDNYSKHNGVLHISNKTHDIFLTFRQNKPNDTTKKSKKENSRNGCKIKTSKRI